MPTHVHYKYKRNKLLNWKVGQMQQCGVIFKVLHADPETSTHFGASLDIDIEPFMLYSLNKQKRWEIAGIIDQNLLEILQFLNDNLDVMVFQRVTVRAWIDNFRMFPPHYITAFSHSKIKESAELSKTGEYKEEVFGGAGRFYGPSTPSTKKVNRTPTDIEIVTYNIVQEPRNWKKVFTKDFRKWPWDRHNATHHRKAKYDPKTIKLDLEEYYDDEGNDPVDLDKDLPCNWIIYAPKTYDFADHIVAKKPRKSSRKHKDLDGFVLV